MNSTGATKWKEAFQEKYKTLLGYHTWKLVKKPPKVNIVGNRWTFRVKHDNLRHINKFKAQLVAQGFSQIPWLDYNQTCSHTICFTSIRLILSLVCIHDLKLKHVDIKGAYLNGKREDDVYMHQPEGFIEEGKENMVCKLSKGVYRLRQSGQVWHQMLR